MSDNDDSIGEVDCPLCCVELDVTDRAIQYCDCGFQMCLWCYNRILEEARKENMPAKCPNCRSEYDQNKISMQHIDAEELEEEKRKLRERERPKASGIRQTKANLANIRVVQPNLVYAVGLGLEICHEEVLKEQEFFGQFGKAVKISVNRNNQYASAVAKHGPTGSAYVTFKRSEDALRCIKTIDGALWRGKPVKACFGTTKYCNAFLKGVPCNNPDCLYLHELADEADCLTKEEVAAGLLPARFLAMGATNTFKPRLTINVIPNATTAAAQAAASAAAASGAGNAAITAAAAAAGGISRTHSQHVVASNAPRVLTIPASSVLLRKDGPDSGNNSAWDSPAHHTHMLATAVAAPPPPSSYPPMMAPPAPKGVWASAVASGGGGGSGLGGVGGGGVPMAAVNPIAALPPLPSDKSEWPTLAGAPGGGGDVMSTISNSGGFGSEVGGYSVGGDDGRGGPVLVARAPSMAEQLARSQSGEVNKSKQGGRKLMPLSSPGKLKPLGKAVAQRSNSPGFVGGGPPESNGNGLPPLEATLGGLTLKSADDLTASSSSLTLGGSIGGGGGLMTEPPPGLGSKVIAPPPGFGAVGSGTTAGTTARGPSSIGSGVVGKKVPPPPGFGGPALSSATSSMDGSIGDVGGGGVFSPFNAPLVGGSLFGGGGSGSNNTTPPLLPGGAAAAGPPPGLPAPPAGANRRQKSRFAFAQAEEDAMHNNANAARGGHTMQTTMSSSSSSAVGPVPSLTSSPLWLGGSSSSQHQQQQQLSPQHHVPSQQDANAFFKTLFPGATVNVAVASGSTPPSGGISPLAGGGVYSGGGSVGGQQQQHQMSSQQQQQMYSPLGEMFGSSPQQQQQGGGSGMPPGLALLRQLQGTPGSSGGGVQGQQPPPGYGSPGPSVPPGFGALQNGPPPGFGLPL